MRMETVTAWLGGDALTDPTGDGFLNYIAERVEVLYIA